MIVKWNATKKHNFYKIFKTIKMKKSITKLILIFAALIITSCSKNGEILELTNEKTIGLIKVNINQLMKKMPKEEILKDTLNKNSTADKELRLLLNADENGVDTDKPLYITTEIDKNEFITSFVFNLSNKNLFISNFSEIFSKKIEIDETKNIVTSDGEAIGAFKNDIFVYSVKSSVPFSGLNLGQSYSYQTETPVSEEFFKEFFNRKKLEDEKVTDNINEALNTNSDLSVWFNIHGLISNLSKGYIETLAINKLLIGAGFGGNIDFQEGIVTMTGKTFFNDEMKKIVEKHYNGKEIDYNIVKNVELDNAISYGIGYFSFDFVKYFVKEAGFESTINKYLEMKDLTFDDLINTFDGNYAMASYANKPTEDLKDELMQMYSASKPNTLVVLGLKETKSKKLMDFLQNDPLFKMAGNFNISNKSISFSTEESNFDLIKANKEAKNAKLDKVPNVTSYGYTSGKALNEVTSTMKSKVNLVEMITKVKTDDGISSADLLVTFDKKEKNILHYIMGYE